MTPTNFNLIREGRTVCVDRGTVSVDFAGRDQYHQVWVSDEELEVWSMQIKQ